MLLCHDCQLVLSRPHSIAAIAEEVFDCAWRFDFNAPGFAIVDLGPDMDSTTLRSMMVELKERLSEICIQRTGKRLIYLSMGRFDQQETTKFHLDGAPDQSLLLLGYEPSRVRSRLFLADYTKCAHDQGFEPKRILTEFNPMFAVGQQMLADYITEVPEPTPGHSRIVLVNNSSLAMSAVRENALGVMHKAEIINPTPSQSRIVNSIMLAAADPSAVDLIGGEQQLDFVQTDRISQKVY